MKKNRSENKFNRISKKWNVVFNLILLTAAITTLIPMILLVVISFSSTRSIKSIGYNFFPLEWSLEGYLYLGKIGQQLIDSYIVTIAHSVLGTFLSLFVITMYAYVLCQRRFWLRRALTWFMFFTMLFGGGLVPSYIFNVRYYHLKDSFWIFILPGLINGSWIIMMRTFITTSIPESLLESARIDGAGHFKIYVRIVLPLLKAGIATLSLFSIVGRWNDWFTGMLYIQSPKLVPLQTLLTKLQKSADFLKSNSRLASTVEGVQMLKNIPEDNLRMACTVIVIAPLLFAYPFFQKYFVKGLTVGSIKE